ncbi:MAG TPA: ABC transporter permease [Thermoanaerobaculia bacterium]|nr:ABC transporter permease [Thermoanaerobaculia bacterium]
MRKTLGRAAVPLLAIAAAFALGAIIVVLIGDDPVETYRLLIGSALSWPDGIGYTLFYATPLIFTGLAVALALHAGLLNIGAEGQLYVGAFAAAWVGIVLAGLSPWVLVPLAMFAAAAAGGAWGAVPGWLKARFGAHEVINTIMMNFIAVALTSYFTQYHFKEAGDPIMQTGPIGEGARIARLGGFIPGLPERIPLNVSFLIAIAACIAVSIFLWRTRWGYSLRATGANPAAAEYGGIRTGRQIIIAMTLSGALAGMVGIGEVLGYRYRFYDGFSAGYGFTGIAVALLARRSPLGVFLAALLFGALLRGGLFVDIFTEKVSKDLVLVLQAIIIIFVASAAGFRLPFTGSSKGEGKV